MTLSEYYKAYKSLLGALSGLVAAVPLLSLVPSSVSPYVFPPLGGAGGAARGASIFAALATTFVVYFIKPRKPIRTIVLCVIISVACAFVYAGVFLAQVRTVEILAKHDSVSVSVGFYRSQFAIENFPGYSDEEILRARGLADEEIRRCWTPASLWSARLLLWLPLSFALITLVAAFGLGIATDGATHATVDKPAETRSRQL